MDTELLKTFIAFADTTSFTRAAEQLHLSQPAVYAQVKRLTEQVGVPLYRRKGRGLELTAEGTQLAAFAHQQLGAVDQFLAELRGEAGERPFVFGAGVGTWLYLLPPFVDWWQGEAPLRPAVMSAPDMLTALREQRIDAGLTRLDAAPPDLWMTPWVKVSMAVLLRASHPLAEHRRLSIEQLVGEPLIVPSAGRPHRVRIEEAFQSLGHHPTIAAEVDGWDLQRMFVGSGMGAAIVNDYCPPPEGCVARQISGMPTHTWSLVCRADGPRHPKLREVVSWFDEDVFFD